MYTFVYIRRSYKRDHYVFYEHADTRISSLSYIKLECLDNDILTKSIFKNLYKLWNERKTKKKKMLHIPVSNPHLNKSVVCMERNSLTPKPLGHSAVDFKGVITCTVQGNRTS